ncbi:MAG: TSUP family transporter, partial [Ilumatobacteraceae bacterium]
VIAINSVVALVSRWHGGSIEWGTVVPFAVASILGVAVGTRLAGTRDPSSLQKGFIALLVAVAVYTGVRSGISLL